MQADLSFVEGCLSGLRVAPYFLFPNGKEEGFSSLKDTCHTGLGSSFCDWIGLYQLVTDHMPKYSYVEACGFNIGALEGSI